MRGYFKKRKESYFKTNPVEGFKSTHSSNLLAYFWFLFSETFNGTQVRDNSQHAQCTGFQGLQVLPQCPDLCGTQGFLTPCGLQDLWARQAGDRFVTSCWELEKNPKKDLSQRVDSQQFTASDNYNSVRRSSLRRTFRLHSGFVTMILKLQIR